MGKASWSLLCGLALLSACSTVDYTLPGEENTLTWGSSELEEAKQATRKAMLSLGEGNVSVAVQLAEEALRKDPKNAYAMMIAGVSYDISGSPAKAKRYYEDLIELDAMQLSTIGNLRNIPPLPMRDVAKRRLQDIENPQPVIAKEVEPTNGKPKAVLPEDVFTEADRNAVSRFMLFKRLAEEGLITKPEFAVRRNNNVGALLPNSKKAPSAGLDKPISSAEDIMARLNDLRFAFYQRALTPQEHEAERLVIIDTILPPESSVTAFVATPPDTLLKSAAAMRRAEILFSLNLITEDEKKAEQAAIESNTRKALLESKGFDTITVIEEAEKVEIAPVSDAPVAVSSPKALVNTKKTVVKKRSNPGVVTGRNKK